MHFLTIAASAAFAFCVVSAAPVASPTPTLKVARSSTVMPSLFFPAKSWNLPFHTFRDAHTAEETGVPPRALIPRSVSNGAMKRESKPLMRLPFYARQKFENFTEDERRRMILPDINFEHLQPCHRNWQYDRAEEDSSNSDGIAKVANKTLQPRQALVFGPNGTEVHESVTNKLSENVLDVFELINGTIAHFKLMQEIRNLTEKEINATLAFETMIQMALNKTSPAEVMVKDLIKTLTTRAWTGNFNGSSNVNKTLAFDAMVQMALNKTSPAETMVNDFLKTLVTAAWTGKFNETSNVNKTSTILKHLFPAPFVPSHVATFLAAISSDRSDLGRLRFLIASHPSLTRRMLKTTTDRL